jgi:opacity protein-like surface antigen
MRWLGTEIEAFNTTPHVKQQTLTVSGMGQSSTDPDVSGRHFRVTTIALNVIARYPGTRVQPYVGVGFGGFFYQMQGFTEGFAPGLNALAGARVFLAEHVALFAEYKYTHATLQFKDLLGVGTGTVNATYSTNAVVGGLSLHF